MSNSVIPWIALCQALLSSAISQSLLKFCALNQWCHQTNSSSAALFPFCLQSFPASGSFPTSQLFTSGGQSTRTLASASVLSMNIQGWSPLGLTGLISLQSKGLSRVFSSTTIQKHQFFDQPVWIATFDFLPLWPNKDQIHKSDLVV